MLKKISLALISAGILFSTNSMATENLSTMSKINYTLTPHVPLLVKNIFFFEMVVNCKLNPNIQAPLFFQGVQGEGSIGDYHLSGTNTYNYTVKVDETLKLSAKPNSAVKITNQGDTLVTAECERVA